jgi:hypothetical protein
VDGSKHDPTRTVGMNTVTTVTTVTNTNMNSGFVDNDAADKDDCDDGTVFQQRSRCARQQFVLFRIFQFSTNPPVPAFNHILAQNDKIPHPNRCTGVNPSRS